jgi:hypothetical protein
MIEVSKPSDRMQKQYRKYSEYAALIPTLKNFDWYEITAFQNKLLPSTHHLSSHCFSFSLQHFYFLVKFLTAASYWFMVCCDYFPRRMVYYSSEEVIKDLQDRI